MNIATGTIVVLVFAYVGVLLLGLRSFSSSASFMVSRLDLYELYGLFLVFHNGGSRFVEAGVGGGHFP